MPVEPIQLLEDVSPCALLLMDVAKRVDRMFGVTQSVAHTARDAKKDIAKIVEYLLSEKATTEVEQRQTSIKFEDPSITGCSCVANGQIDSYLKGEVDDDNLSDRDASDEVIDDIINLNYELYDVV